MRKRVLNLRAPSRWTVALIAGVLVLVALAVAREPITEFVRGEQLYQATALTAGRADLDLTVPKSNVTAATVEEAKPGRPVALTTALPEGTAEPAAPLMTWYNADVAEGKTQRWCLLGDADLNDIVRDILNDLAAAFPQNVRWVEDCANPAYWAGEGRAAIDCGMDQAVGCAVYLSDRSGRVTHNPAYTDTRPNRLQVLRTTYAHELQHLALNLGHNPCGVILDPANGQPVPSVMTPVDLGRGASCSEPAARGLEPADWFYAYGYYDIPVPGVPPEPSPGPPPARQIAIEIWLPKAGDCPAGYAAWDTWCVTRSDTAPLPPDAAGWSHRVEIQPDGTIVWLDEWTAVP
ncbi:MAG: hypothetical protein AB7R89_16145 [Dehalococcoidia bacterium]